MDLHVYRNSQDRWHDLRSAARERGAVLALNAVTLDELVGRISPDVSVATPGQKLAIVADGQNGPWTMVHGPWSISAKPRYAYDAVSELKAARIRSSELRSAGADA